MKIVFDNIIFSLQSSGGISVVWANLLDRIIRKEQINYRVIEYGSPSNIFRKNIDIPIQNIEHRNLKFLKLFRYLSPKLVELREKFIFHSSYYRVCFNPYAINITTVHDFTYEYFRHGIARKIHSWQKEKAIRNSDYIVCISKNTKKDLLKFIPDIDPGKVRVIYNGVSDSYYIMDSVPYPQYMNFVLFLGARDDYKNFKFTVNSLKSTRFNLLICGKPLSCDEEQFLNVNLGSDRYILLSGISDEELNKVYNSVYCLSYPSSYEGFGIPVIEAQKAGCPVICLNMSSIPEIVGENYPTLNNLSTESFVKLLNLFSDFDSRDKIKKLGSLNAQRFSWDKMFEEYLSLYAEALKESI